GEVSATTFVCFGSRGVTWSSAVEKVAAWSRTMPVRPVTSTNQPSLARSMPVTSHSSSRTSTTEPGAKLAASGFWAAGKLATALWPGGSTESECWREATVGEAPWITSTTLNGCTGCVGPKAGLLYESEHRE